MYHKTNQAVNSVSLLVGGSNLFSAAVLYFSGVALLLEAQIRAGYARYFLLLLMAKYHSTFCRNLQNSHRLLGQRIRPMAKVIDWVQEIYLFRNKYQAVVLFLSTDISALHLLGLNLFRAVVFPKKA